MALIQSRTLPQLNIPLSPILSSLHAPSSLVLRREIRAAASPFYSSSARNFPISPLTPSRKLLCPPPRGKFVREDYLVKKLSAQELQEMVKGDRTVPLIVDFYATWCGPCILMAQELEMLAVEYESNAVIVKVDTDDEYEFARDMQGLTYIIVHQS
ncbi:hypothetical protein CARUB_v10014745mg [Capsella rubella]|uniref:Thioredoxin domain-containing protein n=1 Tax=Capsella rubella TaxID=81985 RepID=R0G7H4_9BRAS|nr:hypothetical protein CARUB_v10014745mg [Capsella rubella]